MAVTITLHTAVSQSTSNQAPKARRRWIRVVSALFVLAIIVGLYPPVFQFGVRSLAICQAWRSGARMEIGSVSGSVLEPISFSTVKLTAASPAGITTINIKKATASFSITRLLFKRETCWLSELVLEGLDGEVEFAKEGAPEPAESEPARASRPAKRQAWFPLPARVETRGANFTFHQNDEMVRLKEIDFNTNEFEPGKLRVRQIEVREPWLTKTFTNVRGTVALHEGKISVGEVVLEPGMRVENASADIAELVNGRLDLDFHVSAFGGAIRGELRNAPKDNRHLNFEATGSFERIAIAGVADFLGSPEAAGGLVKEGKFTFHGSPRDLQKATLSTRLEATDFRWGKRQWNSLILGATMVNRRLQVPELRLQQAHNALTLKGEIAMPDSGGDWLQSEFVCDVKAKIENLTELSVLFGPDFANMAGKLTVEGSVRGQKRSFDGQLIVSGSQLSYGAAPLDMLQGSVKLNGNEIQVVHFEFVHKDDYLRGQGTVNIFGERRYWGEIKASIENLAVYSALMRPPIAPQAFAGGLMLDWSGDGTEKAHSGAFRARLKKVRTLVPTANAFVFDANMEATYAPQNIFFSKFEIANGDTALEAKVTASPASLNLEGIRMRNRTKVWLEGGAFLPLNVWDAWRNPTSTALWDPTGECKINLVAKALDLHEAALLTGRDFPVKGELSGTLTGDGPLADPKIAGQLKLVKGDVPILPGLSGSEASVTVSDKVLTFEKFAGRMKGVDFTATGSIDVSHPHDPALALAVQAKSVPIALRDDVKLKADLDLGFSGPLSAGAVMGTVRVVSAEVGAKLDLLSLILFEKHGDFTVEAPFAITQSPFDRWQIDLQCTSNAPIKLGANLGTVRPDLQLSGLAAAPQVSGSIEFGKMTFTGSSASVAVDAARFYFQSQSPGIPILDVRYTAKAGGYEINGFLFGPLDQKLLLLTSEPPLPEQTIFRLLVRGFAPKSPADQLPDLLEGVPFAIASPFLPDGNLARSFFNLPPIEGPEFALHSLLCPPGNAVTESAQP